MKHVEQTTVKRSARSQASILQEKHLQISLKKVETAITRTQERIEELEIDIARVTKDVLNDGRVYLQRKLDEEIAELTTQRGRIDPYNHERARIQAEIEGLFPSPAQVQARAEQQGQFAKLENERLGKDRRADQLLAELRQILRERNELTTEMAKSAELFDLTVSGDALDASRFEQLLASLPEELLASSERWHAWFFGKPKDVKSYVVCEEHLEVRETLAHHGIYRFGELIQLPEKEAREFLRRDRPDPERPGQWNYLSPSIMTVEAYEAAAAEAKEKGSSVTSMMASEKDKFEWEAKQQYDAARKGGLREIGL